MRDVDDEPDEERHGQPPVAGRRQDHGAGEVDDDVDQHVEQLHHHFAHGERGLHQLGADAAGELVLEVAHRLADAGSDALIQRMRCGKLPSSVWCMIERRESRSTGSTTRMTRP